MAARTMAEFVNIAQPIVEEYRNELIKAFSKLKKDIEEKLSDMNESEASIFYVMLTDVQKEIDKMAEE